MYIHKYVLMYIHTLLYIIILDGQMSILHPQVLPRATILSGFMTSKKHAQPDPWLATA